MVEYRSKCEGCYDEGSICVGECNRTATRTFYCDECGDETPDLYSYRNDELCRACLLTNTQIKWDNLYE